MKTTLLLALMSALSLPGCAGVIVADASRKEARVTIGKVMAVERPGVDNAEAAICVQKAMSIVETTRLGLDDSHRGVPAANREKVLTYAARPEAATCLDALPVAEVMN
ncbi:MAG: hypothetical protein WBO29_15855 [Albidovulum sp.]